VTPFQDGREHLEAELHLLRLRVARAVARFRALHPHAPDHFQGVYISDGDVDRLLAETLASPAGPPVAGDEIAAAEAVVAARLGASRAAGTGLPLQRLTELFGLWEIDRRLLLVAAAPDLDPRFETLYAYLQDDIARRRPTLGLAQSLLPAAPAQHLDLRLRLSPTTPLVDHGLLRFDGDGPLPSRPLRVDDRVIDHLLGGEGSLDSRLHPLVRLTQPRSLVPRVSSEVTARLQRLAQGPFSAAAGRGGREGATVPLLAGPPGSDVEVAAHWLAYRWNRPLLELSCSLLLGSQHPLPPLVAALRRETILQGAALLLADVCALTGDHPRVAEARAAVQPLFAQPSGPIVCTCTATVDLAAILPGVRVLEIDFGYPDHHRRLAAWRAALDQAGSGAGEDDLVRVASKFVLTPGQIDDAAGLAAELARLDGEEGAPLSSRHLHQAARAHSHHGLSSLARKVELRAGWEDIVLPEPCRIQLHEIASAVETRHVVLDSWGFERKLSRGRGLNVLFGGGSGTGKTLAAEVLAGELGLDLYEIDLATVVSKYIGETEKNLRRIFDEARRSNAILFFDEADALFGKRSEVRDAHDRYANIEIAYLLQLMEEYEGMAILATNLRQNVDEAFARRMQYVVEFPFPNPELRRRIWQQVFPGQTPVAEEVDFGFLAQRFELAGGSIRGAALGAAALAAGDGGVVVMDHLALAVAREYQKLGRLPSRSEFGPYYDRVMRRLTTGGGER
jgi:hypothetical protein